MADHDQCNVGVNYREVRGEAAFSYPCIYHEMQGGYCKQFENYTEKEIAESEAKIKLFIERLNNLQSGKSNTCPHCGEQITSMQKIVRCVYAQPCNCRLWQGKVPQVWQKESRE
jgi:hypothetical protein